MSHKPCPDLCLDNALASFHHSVSFVVIIKDFAIVKMGSHYPGYIIFSIWITTLFSCLPLLPTTANSLRLIWDITILVKIEVLYCKEAFVHMKKMNKSVFLWASIYAIPYHTPLSLLRSLSSTFDRELIRIWSYISSIFVFIPTFLRFNWHITLSKCKLCNVLLWYS